MESNVWHADSCDFCSMASVGGAHVVHRETVATALQDTKITFHEEQLPGYESTMILIDGRAVWHVTRRVIEDPDAHVRHHYQLLCV